MTKPSGYGMSQANKRDGYREQTERLGPMTMRALVKHIAKLGVRRRNVVVADVSLRYWVEMTQEEIDALAAHQLRVAQRTEEWKDQQYRLLYAENQGTNPGMPLIDRTKGQAPDYVPRFTIVRADGELYQLWWGTASAQRWLRHSSSSGVMWGDFKDDPGFEVVRWGGQANHPEGQRYESPNWDIPGVKLPPLKPELAQGGIVRKSPGLLGHPGGHYG